MMRERFQDSVSNVASDSDKPFSRGICNDPDPAASYEYTDPVLTFTKERSRTT